MTSQDNNPQQPLIGDPPEINIVLHWLGRFGLWLLGWRVIGTPPKVPRLVVTAGLHTANMDGLLMIFTSWVLRVRMRWMVKAEWTRYPIIGAIVRATGAMGIDRSGSFNTVEQAVNEFNAHDRMVIVVPPEGTRRKTDHWKTGFYWIAVGAGTPILTARIDYAKKTLDISGDMIHPTGDIEADMPLIWAKYEGVTARHPEKVSDFKLRPTAKRNPIREQRPGNDNPS